MELVRLREQINSLAEALLPSRAPVFDNVSLLLPNVDGVAELAFIRTASWLYVHYFEAGRVGIRFLVYRHASGSSQGARDHLDLVHALRTWSQHNINPMPQGRDARILVICETWFNVRCGTRLPRTEDQWASLVEALLTEARDFFNHLLSLLDLIEDDDDRDIICQQWEDRLKRDWPAHRYHSLIAVVAADLGRTAVDPVAFYSRHGQVIRDALKILDDDSDFGVEIRKQIEHILLTDTAAVLPITGSDVITYFGISPGPEVGRLLALARHLYDDRPCDRDQLLERMRDVWSDADSGRQTQFT